MNELDRAEHEETQTRLADKMRMAQWVNGLARWRVISHLTFSWECSLDSGRRVYERFMARHLPQVSYFYALEENPSRDGFHVHALWADTARVFRKEVWAAWFNRYGRARIEPVRSFEDVSGYCSKYVTKERAWWNVKLQWHRIQAMHDLTFKLDDSEWWLSPNGRGAREENESQGGGTTLLEPVGGGESEEMTSDWNLRVVELGSSPAQLEQERQQPGVLAVAAWTKLREGVWKCS